MHLKFLGTSLKLINKSKCKLQAILSCGSVALKRQQKGIHLLNNILGWNMESLPMNYLQFGSFKV